MEETVLLDVRRIQTFEQSSIIPHSARVVDLVNHLASGLHLPDSRNEPYNAQKTVVNRLYARWQLAREQRVVLPLSPESLYLLGGMAIAVGKTTEKKGVIIHNRLCEEAGRLLKDEVVWKSIDIIRSVTLPVYRRLVKERCIRVVSLLQAPLHTLTWRSESGWTRDRMQRILWAEGVFGAAGIDSLIAFDRALAGKEMTFPSLRERSIMTVLLAHFLVGPALSD